MTMGSTTNEVSLLFSLARILSRNEGGNRLQKDLSRLQVVVILNLP